MDLYTFLCALCVVVPFMLSTCAADDQMDLRKFQGQYGNYAVQQGKLTLPLLPRKLKLHGEAMVKNFNDKDVLRKRLMEVSSDNKSQSEIEEKNTVHRTGKGTWRQWVDETAPKKSDYFTMDYAWVRRRRPIHNKHAPVNFVP